MNNPKIFGTVLLVIVIIVAFAFVANYGVASGSSSVLSEEDIEEHIEVEMSQPAAGNMTIPQPIANTIVVGESPQFLEYNPSNGNMYVSNWDSGDVSVIDSATNKVIYTIPVGEAPNVLAYNPSNGNIYVSNLDDVLVIDSNTDKVIYNMSVGDGPRFLEYNPGNGNMYVGDEDSNTVSVIDFLAA